MDSGHSALAERLAALEGKQGYRFSGNGRNGKRGQSAGGLEHRRAALDVDLGERQWYIAVT